MPKRKGKKKLDAKEAEYEKKLGDIQKEAQESKQKLEQEISDLKRQSEQTRSDLRRELEEKKTEITKLGKELETFKRNATSLFSQLEGEIKGGMDQLSLSRKNIVSPPPVREVAPVCRETVDRPRPQRSNRLLSVLSLILTIVLLALFAYQMFMGNGFAMGKEQIIIKETKPKQTESSTSTPVRVADWKINVEPYDSEKPMKEGQKYDATVMGAASNLSGTWTSSDFKIVSQNGSTAKISPQKTGENLHLEFKADNGRVVSRDNLVAK